MLSVNTTSPFSHTHASFSDYVRDALGKGHIHAGIIYEEFMRKGEFPPETHPAFHNAKALRLAIIALIDTALPELIGDKSDGATGKFLLRTDDNLEIESVLIPMQAGGTLCISSQVGCRMGCVFCETGRMGLLRSLTTPEIVGQIFVAKHHLGFNVRNVVFMGMGEPFDNYEAVMQAARVLIDPKGLGFGKNHVTISTSGCADGIERLMNEPGDTPNLAVSINAPLDAMRNKLMPVNRKFDMQRLHGAMDAYCRRTGRQILVAYVLMKEVNDSLEHADLLAEYLTGLDVKINLIPYNPQSRDRFQPPETAVLESFSHQLRDHGYQMLLRVTKGSSIMAACGQLGNLELRKKLVRSKK